MDVELKGWLDALKAQAEALEHGQEDAAEQLRVLVAQGAQLIRLLTTETPPREGPTLDEKLDHVIQLLTVVAAAMNQVRDEFRAFREDGRPMTAGGATGAGNRDR